jgi:hypothetical protein
MSTNISVTTDMISDFLCAEYGSRLAVFEDGSHQIVDAGSVPAGEFIAIVKCPGIGNLDSSMFAEGYASLGDDGIYRRIDDGTEIGDLADLIGESCREGDVTGFIEDLERQIETSAADIATSL